jgi:hypothetical protein
MPTAWLPWPGNMKATDIRAPSRWFALKHRDICAVKAMPRE